MDKEIEGIDDGLSLLLDRSHSFVEDGAWDGAEFGRHQDIGNACDIDYRLQPCHDLMHGVGQTFRTSGRKPPHRPHIALAC
jgi:hypothetical protein